MIIHIVIKEMKWYNLLARKLLNPYEDPDEKNIEKVAMEKIVFEVTLTTLHDLIIITNFHMYTMHISI